MPRIAGKVRCREIAWQKPHRSDKTVVRINRLCSSDGAVKSFWVDYEQASVATVNDFGSSHPNIFGFTREVKEQLEFVTRSAPRRIMHAMVVFPALIGRKEIGRRLEGLS